MMSEEEVGGEERGEERGGVGGADLGGGRRTRGAEGDRGV